MLAYDYYIMNILVHILVTETHIFPSDYLLMRLSCIEMHVLTHSQAELQHMHRSFLLQETHKTKQQILLLSDLLQIQLQHLTEQHIKTTRKVLFETFIRHENH